MFWVRIGLGLQLCGAPPCVSRCLLSCNHFATSAALVEVCALLNIILVIINFSTLGNNYRSRGLKAEQV